MTIKNELLELLNSYIEFRREIKYILNINEIEDEIENLQNKF